MKRVENNGNNRFFHPHVCTPGEKSSERYGGLFWSSLLSCPNRIVILGSKRVQTNRKRVKSPDAYVSYCRRPSEGGGLTRAERLQSVPTRDVRFLPFRDGRSQFNGHLIDKRRSYRCTVCRVRTRVTRFSNRSKSSYTQSLSRRRD